MWIMTLPMDVPLYPMLFAGRIYRGMVRLKRSSVSVATRGYIKAVFLQVVLESRTDSRHNRFGDCDAVSAVG